MPVVDTRIDYFGRVTALFGPSYAGNVAKLKELLVDPAFRALINYGYDSQGDHTPIFFACYGGANADAVQELLDKGANPFKRDIIGRIALHLAANSNDPEILRVLLAVTSMELFVDDAAADTGQTPFHTLFLPGSGNGPAAKAANANLADCLTQLVAKSRNPLKSLNIADKNGLTPLMLAKHFNLLGVFDGLAPELRAQLNLDSVVVPANIADLLKVDFYGRSEFLEAAFVSHDGSAGAKANKELFKKYLAEGADTIGVVNKQSGRNALQLVFCASSDGEAAKAVLDAPQTVLIAANGKVNADHKGRTFMHFAANTGRFDTNAVIYGHEKFKAQQDELVKALDSLDRSPLHAAAMAASRTTLSEAEKAAGETLSEREKVIDMLFAAGVDHKLVDKNGQTALQIADQRGNKVVAARIRHNLALQVSSTQAFDALASLRAAFATPPVRDVFAGRELAANKAEEAKKAGPGGPSLTGS